MSPIPCFSMGQPVNADAEGEAAEIRRVVVHEAVHGGSTCPHRKARSNRSLCTWDSPCRAVAENAGCVEFDGRFGKTEKSSIESASFGARAKKFANEILDRAFEIRNVRSGVNGKPFHLVEDIEGVRASGLSRR